MLCSVDTDADAQGLIVEAFGAIERIGSRGQHHVRLVRKDKREMMMRDER